MCSVITSYSIHYTKLYDLKLGEGTGVQLQYNGIDYDISPDPPVVLEVANQIKLSLPEGVELKEGDRNNFV